MRLANQAKKRLGVCLSLIGSGFLSLAQNSPTIRDQSGVVACIVSQPSTRSTAASLDSDRVTVELRAPATPPTAIVAKLPGDKRDFSTLPVEVSIVPSPTNAAEVKEPRRIAPLSVEPTLVRPTIDGRRSANLFIRVAYPRDVLQPGVDIVATRTAVAASGERVVSETRCRITEADAVQWR
jgi:hypothetical protein